MTVNKTTEICSWMTYTQEKPKVSTIRSWNDVTFQQGKPNVFTKNARISGTLTWKIQSPPQGNNSQDKAQEEWRAFQAQIFKNVGVISPNVAIKKNIKKTDILFIVN